MPRFGAGPMLGKMPRAALFGIALLAAALVSAGCSSLPGAETRKPSADEVAQVLSRNEAGATEIGCAAERDGWDYVCTFTAVDGRRKKVGLLINEDGLEKASSAIDIDAQLAPPRAAGDEEFDAWIAQVNSTCSRNAAAMRALPRPTSPAEFGDYARQLSKLGDRYLSALSALPPPPDPEDRRIFNRLIALLEHDDQGTLALSKAIQRGDVQGAQQAIQELGQRDAQESELFNRLGGNCL
jgi:hypothetical protein